MGVNLTVSGVCSSPLGLGPRVQGQRRGPGQGADPGTAAPQDRCPGAAGLSSPCATGLAAGGCAHRGRLEPPLLISPVPCAVSFPLTHCPPALGCCLLGILHCQTALSHATQWAGRHRLGWPRATRQHNKGRDPVMYRLSSSTSRASWRGHGHLHFVTQPCCSELRPDTHVPTAAGRLGLASRP